MSIFYVSLGRMAILFSFMLIGFVLVKAKILDTKASGIFSKLVVNVFLPALCFSTFSQQFTLENLKSSGTLVLVSVLLMVITIPLGIFLSRFFSSQQYLRRIYNYGLVFPNIGFMGNAVMLGIFPEIFPDYLIFTLIPSIAIYVWGIPFLLIADPDNKPTVRSTLKSVATPTMISTVLGILIGISGITLPGWFNTLTTDAGACMSPLAMILTGIAIAGIDIFRVIKNVKIWIASFIRLLAIPIAAIFVMSFLELSFAVETCLVCMLAMPLGLNSVVFPSAYGRDITDASGMALISHTLSCITIPVIILLMNLIA